VVSFFRDRLSDGIGVEAECTLSKVSEIGQLYIRGFGEARGTFFLSMANSLAKTFRCTPEHDFVGILRAEELGSATGRKLNEMRVLFLRIWPRRSALYTDMKL